MPDPICSCGRVLEGHDPRNCGMTGCWGKDDPECPCRNTPITLRDRFVMAALAGSSLGASGMDPEMIARLMYEIADAMLEERRRPT